MLRSAHRACRAVTRWSRIAQRPMRGRRSGENAMDSFFARQLATYASYHRDERNRATHFIGIPAIVFSILLPLALVRWPAISAAMPVAAAGADRLDRARSRHRAGDDRRDAADADRGGMDRAHLWQRDRVDRVRRVLYRRLGASAGRARLGGPPPGARRQSVPGFHRPDVPDGRGADGARPQAGFEGGDRRRALKGPASRRPESPWCRAHRRAVAGPSRA